MSGVVTWLGRTTPKWIEKMCKGYHTGLSTVAETHGDGSRKTKVYYPTNADEYDDLMMEWAHEANEDYWGFEISYIPHPIQLLEYNVGDHYDWHMDLGPGDGEKRKLSIIIQLSDPYEYEGGSVILKSGKEFVVPKEKGAVCIFPSYILHKVEPITKGTRRALVCWVLGDEKLK